MTKIYFVNERSGKRYEILGVNNDAGEITLKGAHSTFTEKYDKARFKSLGYVLKKEEVDHAVQS